jgi:carbon-monoxide dehydrogenase medium subunit
MKAPAFDYERPDSVQHAATLLARASGEGRLLAGGQTLGPMLNLRLVAPRLIIDIGHIAALKQIEERSGRLVIGAGATHAMLEDRSDRSPLGRLLAHAAGSIAYRAIRNRGTVGGSLSHADPAADWITTMILLDADIVVADSAGRRRVPMREFMLGAFATALGPAEVLEAIEITHPSSEARWGYIRICRKSGEFPEAVGAVLLDPARGISRIVAGALDGAPALLPALAQRVAAEGAAAATIDNVTAAIANAAPGFDAFERQIHAVAVRRAILQATAS